MVRTTSLLICWCLAGVTVAQDSTMFRGAGLLRGSAAISPGFSLDRSMTNIYVNGKLEYFTDDRLSFRGESFWYIDSQRKPAFLAQNSQIAAGPFYHWGRGRLDAALGFEAGISFAQPRRPVAAVEYEDLRAVPSISLCAGLTYTVWDYFHFFLDARYVHARYTGSFAGTIPLDEVIISGGLGWQLRLKK